MSELERRIRGGKVRWVARYFDPDGGRRGKVFDRKVDAQRFQAQIETSKITGSYVDPARGKVAGDTRALEAVHTGSIPGHCVQAH
jgi:hypothetical protein